jgi:hypothetical protein
MVSPPGHIIYLITSLGYGPPRVWGQWRPHGRASGTATLISAHGHKVGQLYLHHHLKSLRDKNIHHKLKKKKALRKTKAELNLQT